MPLIQTQAPAIEPITRDDAKLHCRVDSDLTEDDALIDLMISACRGYAERETGRSLITQKWRLVLDSFPGGMLSATTPSDRTYSHPGNAVLFERGPVQSVDSIVYVDMAGATQTITAPGAPAYAVDLTGAVGRMTPGFGRIWPIPLPQIGAVQINYTAGYGATAASVPASVRLWMLAAVQTVYRNRGLMVELQRGETSPAFDFIAGMLDEIRVVLA